MSELVTDAMVEAARALLAAEGADSQDGWLHSWRCFDKVRYPEGCACTAQAARSALEAAAPLVAANALRDAAIFPGSQLSYAAREWLRARADEIERGES